MVIYLKLIDLVVDWVINLVWVIGLVSHMIHIHMIQMTDGIHWSLALAQLTLPNLMTRLMMNWMSQLMPESQLSQL
jgi:hypothetical protein